MRRDAGSAAGWRDRDRLPRAGRPAASGQRSDGTRALTSIPSKRRAFSVYDDVARARPSFDAEARRGDAGEMRIGMQPVRRTAYFGRYDSDPRIFLAEDGQISETNNVRIG